MTLICMHIFHQTSGMYFNNYFYTLVSSWCSKRSWWWYNSLKWLWWLWLFMCHLLSVILIADSSGSDCSSVVHTQNLWQHWLNCFKIHFRLKIHSATAVTMVPPMGTLKAIKNMSKFELMVVMILMTLETIWKQLLSAKLFACLSNQWKGFYSWLLRKSFMSHTFYFQGYQTENVTLDIFSGLSGF